MFQKTIGILGGMGPVASADTYVELTKMCQQKYKCVQDADFPAVVLYSLPLLEFSHEGFLDDADQRTSILNQLKNALQKLEKAGANIIIIDCNTVHHFFNDLQASIAIPIINLIDVTVEKIKSSGYTNVAVLCSQTSHDVGLYTTPLQNANVHVLTTNETEQTIVNNAILAVMGGNVTMQDIGAINGLIEKFTDDGAQCIILGCTEISNIAKQLTHKAILIDSEALAIARAMELAR